MIRTATAADAEALAAIYDHHIAHTVITFEEEGRHVEDRSPHLKVVDPTNGEDNVLLVYLYFGTIAEKGEKRVGAVTFYLTLMETIMHGLPQH